LPAYILEKWLSEFFIKKSGGREHKLSNPGFSPGFNRSEAVEVEVKDPLVLAKVNIAKEVFEADRIINIPVMKVHYATGITLALKNLKGLLVRDEKRRFHEIGLDKAIVDLNSTGCALQETYDLRIKGCPPYPFDLRNKLEQ
jgi:uncharacterized Fe-S center protein